MDIRIAQIIIWEGKAFVPSKARFPSGLFTSIEPIQILNPTLADLVPAIQSILSMHPREFINPTIEEIKIQQDIIPKKLGVRNWKQVCQRGISYVIELSEKGYLLEMSQLDKKGRWEFDPEKRLSFDLKTDLSDLINAILKDLETRLK